MRIPSPRVRELRHNQTEAEKAAWYLLRGRRLRARFRRQHPIGNGVVDFFCREHRLAIELDGGVHSQPSQMRKDALREDYFRGLGIRLVRLPNGLVLKDPEGFLRKVREWIGQLWIAQDPAEQVTPHPALPRLRDRPPSPPRGRGDCQELRGTGQDTTWGIGVHQRAEAEKQGISR
jgi:very-short-patch-repair endonuclease